MGYAYVNAQKLHEEIDALAPDDMAKVLDFIGYLKSRAVRPPKYNETEEERQVVIEKALETLIRLDTASRFGDPLEWQREVRKDRPLPGREG